MENCLHRNWEVRGGNPVGTGTCLDCNREIGLHILFNGLHEEMVKSMEACTRVRRAGIEAINVCSEECLRVIDAKTA